MSNTNTKTRDIISIPFSLKQYNTGQYRVSTLSGLKVNLLTTNSDDKPYKIKGFIGNSTQLESWSIHGRYYVGNKSLNYSDLILIKNKE